MHRGYARTSNKFLSIFIDNKGINSNLLLIQKKPEEEKAPVEMMTYSLKKIIDDIAANEKPTPSVFPAKEMSIRPEFGYTKIGNNYYMIGQKEFRESNILRSRWSLGRLNLN